MNLLEEIEYKLKQNGKTLSDIKWVGTADFYVDLVEFISLAENANYDSGYGSSEVAKDLIIAGDCWWLERHEYDGSEWFEFKTFPHKPIEAMQIKALTVEQSNEIFDNDYVGWETLESLNRRR